MIADQFLQKWQHLRPVPAAPTVPTPIIIPYVALAPAPAVPPLTDEEVGKLRKLLEWAKGEDARTGQGGCENDDKKRRLKELLEAAGKVADFL